MVAAQCLEEDREDNIANFFSTWCLYLIYVLNTQYPEKEGIHYLLRTCCRFILAQLANWTSICYMYQSISLNVDH